jgi:hypothetical protein
VTCAHLAVLLAYAAAAGLTFGAIVAVWPR